MFKEVYVINPQYIFCKNEGTMSINFQNKKTKKIITIRGEKTSKYLLPYMNLLLFGVEIEEFVKGYFPEKNYADTVQEITSIFNQLYSKNLFVMKKIKIKKNTEILWDLTTDQNLMFIEKDILYFNRQNQLILSKSTEILKDNSDLLIVTDNIIHSVQEVYSIFVTSEFKNIIWMHYQNDRLAITRLNNMKQYDFIKICSNFLINEEINRVCNSNLIQMIEIFF